MSFICTRRHKSQVNPAGAIISGLFLLFLAPGDALAQRDGGATASRRAELAITVSPDVAGLEESGPVLVTLTNQNASSDTQVLPGDVFRLVFDIGNGRIES